MIEVPKVEPSVPHKSSKIGRAPQMSFGNFSSFGSKKCKNKEKLQLIDFKHVQASMAKISEHVDVDANLEIVHPRIGNLSKARREELVPMIPYDFLWSIFVSNPETFSAKVICNIICETAECEGFPADFFINQENLEFLIDLFINRICENQSTIRKMAYYFFNLAVQADADFREVLFSARIVALMNDNKIPPIAIKLLHTMLTSEPAMEAKHNLAVELIYSAVLYGGQVNSIVTLLDFIIERELPAYEGFEPSNLAPIIINNTIKTNSTEVIKRCIICLPILGLESEFCGILLEKIDIFFKLLKNNTNKKEYETFVIWGITLYVQEMSNMESEQVAQGIELFMKLVNEDACYNIQIRVAQCICQLDNSLIQTQEMIDLICKYVSSEKIGAHSIAKLASLLAVPSQPLKEYIFERCIEAEDEINDLLTSSDEETARIAGILISQLDSLKQ